MPIPARLPPVCIGEWTAAQGRVYDFMIRNGTPRRYLRELFFRLACIGGLRDSKPGFVWTVGAPERRLVPDGGILLRFPSSRAAEDRCGVRRGSQNTAGGPEAGTGDRGPVRGQLYPGSAAGGISVTPADNDVADGIRVTADLLKRRRIVLCKSCRDCLRKWLFTAGTPARTGMRPGKSRITLWTICGIFAMDLAGEDRGGFAAAWVERKSAG